MAYKVKLFNTKNDDYVDVKSFDTLEQAEELGGIICDILKNENITMTQKLSDGTTDVIDGVIITLNDNNLKVMFNSDSGTFTYLVKTVR